MFDALLNIWKLLVHTFWFYRLGVPEAGEYFIKSLGEIAAVTVLPFERIIFVSRCAFA